MNGVGECGVDRVWMGKCSSLNKERVCGMSVVIVFNADNDGDQDRL